MMDVNTLRTLITVVLFLSFLGIIYWAWSPRSKRRFDEAANLPFADEELAEASRLGGSTMQEKKHG